MHHSTSHATPGFTLVELLVVIAIVGILAATVLALINPRYQLHLAQDSQRRTDLASLQTALESYSAQHAGLYPVSGNGGFWLCGT